jgi:hypothetical protein
MCIVEWRADTVAHLSPLYEKLHDRAVVVPPTSLTGSDWRRSAEKGDVLYQDQDKTREGCSLWQGFQHAGWIPMVQYVAPRWTFGYEASVRSRKGKINTFCIQ